MTRVLVADDQALLRGTFRLLIDSDPELVTVGEAENGAEAVELARAERPDVVLMDVRMPEMDGVEATRQIFLPERAGRREHPVRVIVLTTFNLDDRAATAIRYGASGFLLKGTTPSMGISPNAGLRPTSPQAADGIRIEPPVSDPIEA